MIARAAFAALLFAGIAVMPIRERWPYGILQIALLIGASAHIVRSGYRSAITLHAVLCAALAWGCFQFAAGSAVYAHATLDKTLDFAAWLAAAWLGAALYNGPARERLAHALAIFGGAIAAAALLIRYTFHTSWMGPFVYENQYAAFIELTLPPALLAAFDPSRRIWGATLAAVMIGSVVVSGSIAGAGIVILETAVAIALLKSAAELPWRAVGTGLAALAMLVLTVGAITGWEALTTDLRRSAPLEVRRQLAQSTLDMARDRPLLGFGLGTWPAVYPAYARFDDGMFDNQAHNDWLQWLAEGGAPFLALMLAAAFLITRAVVRGNLWGIGLVFVLAHCLIEYHFQQRPAFGCLYFAVAGAVCARPAKRR